jgi:hypothetical protein
MCRSGVRTERPLNVRAHFVIRNELGFAPLGASALGSGIVLHGTPAPPEAFLAPDA